MLMQFLECTIFIERLSSHFVACDALLNPKFLIMIFLNFYKNVYCVSILWRGMLQSLFTFSSSSFKHAFLVALRLSYLFSQSNLHIGFKLRVFVICTNFFPSYLTSFNFYLILFISVGFLTCSILHIGLFGTYYKIYLFVCFYSSNSALIFYFFIRYSLLIHLLFLDNNLAGYNYSVCFSFSFTGVFIIFVRA